MGGCPLGGGVVSRVSFGRTSRGEGGRVPRLAHNEAPLPLWERGFVAGWEGAWQAVAPTREGRNASGGLAHPRSGERAANVCSKRQGGRRSQPAQAGVIPSRVVGLRGRRPSSRGGLPSGVRWALRGSGGPPGHSVPFMGSHYPQGYFSPPAAHARHVPAARLRRSSPRTTTACASAPPTFPTTPILAILPPLPATATANPAIAIDE